MEAPRADVRGCRRNGPQPRAPLALVLAVSTGSGAPWSLGSRSGHHQQERTQPWPHLWDGRRSRTVVSLAKAGPKPGSLVWSGWSGWATSGPRLGLSASLWKKARPPMQTHIVLWARAVMGNQKRHVSSIRG